MDSTTYNSNGQILHNSIQKNVMLQNKQKKRISASWRLSKKVYPTTIELKHVNICRIFLKIIPLPNIVNVDGNTIISLYFHKQSHESTPLWQNIPLPPQKLLTIL